MHPLGILTQLAGFKFRPESLLQLSSALLHSLTYSAQLYSPNYSASVLGMHIYIYICTCIYGNTQETSLPAFAQVAASTAVAALSMSLIFISAVVQVFLPLCFQSFSKGADELPGISASTVLLQRAAALCFRSYEKSLLSWVSNRELR